MIRVVITGVCGRMGRCITRGIAQQNDMQLVGAIQYPSHPQIGMMLALSQVSLKSGYQSQQT